jgi:hypothetical protein
MRDISQVLRRKRAQYAQIGKEIQLLEDVEQKLQEVASLLADSDDEDSTLLTEVEEEGARPQAGNAMAAAASGGSSASASSLASSGQYDSNRPAALRWP